MGDINPIFGHYAGGLSPIFGHYGTEFSDTSRVRDTTKNS
jgi:hypothetical protein